MSMQFVFMLHLTLLTIGFECVKSYAHDAILIMITKPDVAALQAT